MVGAVEDVRRQLCWLIESWKGTLMDLASERGLPLDFGGGGVVSQVRDTVCSMVPPGLPNH